MSRKRATEKEIVVSAPVSPRRKPAAPRAKRVAAPAPVAQTETVAASEPLSVPQSPSAEAIARLAYSYWEARGYQGGSPEEDWLRAERELSSCQDKVAVAVA